MGKYMRLGLRGECESWSMAQTSPRKEGRGASSQGQRGGWGLPAESQELGQARVWVTVSLNEIKIALF